MAEFFANPIFKTLLYAGCSAIMWVSILMATTSIIVPAISLSLATLAYGIAIIKRDAPAVALKEPNIGNIAVKAAVASNNTAVKSSRANPV
ncbi:hypothetical protein HDU83_002242 [Entophlyctis luteolus]|nr:hypothetical protein HDU82_002182 [Entophlyctis luteolus]KAJ3355957.1 hypothetical protein HDU83_002242 [Entophlyctis luteolus]KAJ3391160.1 hypothetical protein HDU84_006374 [Entophlyctis sp. JEL0112]